MTDYVSRRTASGNIFLPKKFQGFPEIKEALIADRMQAAFMVAPMAIALRSQGVPIKIVYLGHRYGSAVVRPVVKVLVFGLASAGLWAAGHHTLAVALLVFSVVVNALAILPGIRELAAEGPAAAGSQPR